MRNRSIVFEFGKGLVRDNPVFVQVLGMCPTLAVTTSVVNGMGMGLATLFVLLFSALFATSIRGIVPHGVRIPVYAVIIAMFVTIADLYLRAYIPSLSEALGPYVPLIVVNCIILGRIEAFATKSPVLPSLADALGMGAGFTASLMLLGGVREILGSGSLFGVGLFGDGFTPLLVMVLPPGAFLTLAVLMAGFNTIRMRSQARQLVLREV